ncbi:unnamed protein product [Periconia digitata]|uniref:Uncharacterized protein n=1 Tax=Periconia digitata TaxID=1303443 RepID=A0A9W4XRB6_9PLEO|nr:unnamed protein product [Periconia digitata]
MGIDLDRQPLPSSHSHQLCLPISIHLWVACRVQTRGFASPFHQQVPHKQTTNQSIEQPKLQRLKEKGNVEPRKEMLLASCSASRLPKFRAPFLCRAPCPCPFYHCTKCLCRCAQSDSPNTLSSRGSAKKCLHREYMCGEVSAAIKLQRLKFCC